ncbi:MAG: hypothetical protein AAB229_03790 [Candidatus Hydrogenedentota bacterium]
MVQGVVLTTITFSSRDRETVQDLDERFHRSDACDPWVKSFFIHAYRDLFDDIRSVAPAVAVPYNCGTLIAAPNGKLVGIDLTLLENYYGGRDWNVPGWLYDLISDRLDVLIVSHGHWDHCWVELIWSMIRKGKTVIVPEGIRTCAPKFLPQGCRGVADDARFWWNGLHFAFHHNRHVYDGGRGMNVLTTRIWDGRNVYLHTSDADPTDEERFRWHDPHPVDVLLFKFGGVSPFVSDYDALVRTVDLISPRKLLLPIHLNEFGHRGTGAALPYGHTYDVFERYRAEGRLGSRRYAVLFGNRIVRL